MARTMQPGSSWGELTVLDNATAGADTTEELQKLSREMEDIAAWDSFTFKETLVSGDPVEDDAWTERLPRERPLNILTQTEHPLDV